MSLDQEQLGNVLRIAKESHGKCTGYVCERDALFGCDYARALLQLAEENEKLHQWLAMSQISEMDAVKVADELRTELEQAEETIQALTHEGRQGELEQANVNLANENQLLHQKLDELRAKLEQAEADNAAMVPALEFYADEKGKHWGACRPDDTAETCCHMLAEEIGGTLARQILSTPHPGTALFDELTKLRVVAEAAREYTKKYAYPKSMCAKLCKTLAALDEK